MKLRTDTLLTLLSAIVCAMAFLWDFLAWLVFFSLVPFLYVLYRNHLHTRHLFRYSMLFAAVFHLLAMSWILKLYPMTFLGYNEIQSLVVVAGWLLFAGLLAFRMLILPFGLLCFKQDGFKRVLFTGVCWMGYEWLTELGFFGFPWFRLALPMANLPLIRQFAGIGGSIGISFVLVLINAGLAECWLQYRENRKKALGSGMIAVCSCFLLLVAGWQQVYRPQEIKQSNTLEYQLNSSKIAVIQGNISTMDKWKEDEEYALFDFYMSESEKAIQQGAKWIIWPETAIPIALNEYPEMYQTLQETALQRQVHFIVGSFERNEYRLHNALYAFPMKQVYHKQHLVPFGEALPNWMLYALPFLQDFQLANRIDAGTTNVLLSDQRVKIGSLICFESIFADLTRKQIVDGANVLLIATNDAWYQHSSEITQHKNHAILRAVESNRYVIRAANTGISMIIDPRGTVLQQLPEDEQGILYGQIELHEKETFYHQFPYLIHGICAGLLIWLRQSLQLERIKKLLTFMKFRMFHCL